MTPLRGIIYSVSADKDCASRLHLTMSKRRSKAKITPRSKRAPLVTSSVRSGQRWHHGIAFGVLTVVCTLAFANTLNHEFVWDDNFQIVRNPFLHADEPLTRLFVTDVWGYTHPDQKGTSNYYRPLQMVTYRLIGQIAGLNPSVFHMVNLLFHILTCLAGYLVLWQLTRGYWVALSASLLFALHPIHTEAVVWIAALPELGCSLFFFLSFWLFLLAEESLTNAPTKEKRTLCLQVMSLSAFAIALLWKEMVLTLPILIAAYLFMVSYAGQPLFSRAARSIRRVLPYLAVIGGYLLVRYLVLGFISRVQHVWTMSPSEFVMSILYLAGMYWQKLFLPMHLNSFHLFDPVHSFAEGRFLGALALLTVVGGWIAFAWRRFPVAAFAAAWVFITLLPVFNIRGVGANVFSERYLYIPSLGFCLLAGWLGGQASHMLPSSLRHVTTLAALIVVCVSYAVQTVRRNGAWKDELALFSSAVAESPRSAQMRNSLAQSYLDKGLPLEAERQYQEAIRVGWERNPPDKFEVARGYQGLGGIYVGRQEYAKALDAVETGRKIGNIEMSGSAYGIALLHLGRLEEGAQALYQYHLENPNDEITLDALGVIALSQRDYAKAVYYLQRAVSIVPEFASPRNNLGRTYLEMNRPAEALPHLQKAAALSPNDPVVQTNLATALAALGRIVEAREWVNRALQLAPSYQPALDQLQSLSRASP